MYETGDVEERNVTYALQSLFRAISASGMTEDPLSFICKCLVGHIDDIQFAFYCYEGDETGVISDCREGVKIFLPSPDVQRKIVANMRRSLSDKKVAVIDPCKAVSLLPPSQRKRWKCHLCLAQGVYVAKKRVAMLAVFMKPDFVITERHKTWLSLFGDAASTLLSRQEKFCSACAERDAAVDAHQKAVLSVESMRSGIRNHLETILKTKGDYVAGELSLKTALLDIESSAASLCACSDLTVDCASVTMDEKVLKDKELSAWVDAGLASPRIKAIVGIRGSSKSVILHAVHRRLLSSGVEASRVVLIDFEDARFRRFKTASDVIDYLNAFPKSKEVSYLFLDELGMIGWHSELLKRLQTFQNWNVWVTSSTLHAIPMSSERKSKQDLMVYRTWTDPSVPRSQSELEKLWCQIFMRDVVSGVDHPDIRAKEALAEYYSDHLAEVRSLRDICKELSAHGRSLARSSVSSYRQALVESCLIEISEIYDVFEGAVVSSLAGRVFYTDLELRKWRFGRAPTDDVTRLALNRLYLELRRKYDKVYTPRDRDADFLTLAPDGSPELWKIPADSLVTPENFRGGGKL